MTEKEQAQRAKKYLSAIGEADRLIDRLNGTAARLRHELTAMGSAMQPDRVQTRSGGKSALEVRIAKIVDLEQYIDSWTDELIRRKRDAAEKIRQMNSSDMQSVLLARYVDGAKWEQIAEDMHFSLRHVHRLHGGALIEFARANADLTTDEKV